MQTVAENINTNYYFLLNSFSAEDIDSVTADLRRHFNHEHFIYVIDTYDIVENYLPYTEIELFSKKDRNFQAQKFICYDYFFGRLNKTHTVLLNEYKIELLAAKNKLNRHLRDAKTVINNLETLKKETDDFINHPEKTNEFFRDNFEVILLLLILNDKTQSILEEFFSFIRNRLMVSEIKLKKDSDSQRIDSLFRECRYSKFSTDLFERYIDDNKAQLLSIDSQTDRHIFLENTFRDMQVVDRVMQINQKMVEQGLTYYVVYLSSAHKTVEIFRSLNSLLGISNTQLFHRNIYQYFLCDKLKTDFENRPSEAFEILNALKDIIQKKASESQISPNNKFRYLVKKLFKESSSTIDNHFYLSVYDRYRHTFEQMIGPGARVETPLNHEEVVRIMAEIDKNKKQHKASLFNLDFSLSQLNMTFTIIETFNSFDDFEPEYRYGQDIVRNPYQHLPYLPLLSKDFDSALKSKLYRFLNRNVEQGTTDGKNLKQSLQDVIGELTRMDTGLVESRFLKGVIFTYLNFVAQNKIKKGEKPSESSLFEDSILIDFEKQYKLIRYQYSKLDYNKLNTNNSIELRVTENQQLLNEIVYFLLWVYRRTSREEEGIHRAASLLKSDIDDPRIFEGIGLCYVSKTYKLIKSSAKNDVEEVKKHCDLAFHYLRQARDGYRQLIADEHQSDFEQVVMKNYIATLNSLADISLRKFGLGDESDYRLIDASRDLIEEIKSLLPAIGVVYEKQVTYLSTEIEVGYFEALRLYNQGDKARAHAKIIEISKEIATLNIANKNRNLLDEYFRKAETRVNEFASKIFKTIKK